jgi:uncharacterized cupredoxin-like copper-binding protein
VQSPLHRRAALTLAVLTSLAAPGCGGKRATTEGSPQVVQVTERDFRISAPKLVSAGDVVLSVKNRGPDDHELILVRAGESQLPYRADGLTVDEDAIERSTVDSLPPGAPGVSRTMRVRLTPGRYVLLCNMAGHHLGGMDRKLEVR